MVCWFSLELRTKTRPSVAAPTSVGGRVPGADDAVLAIALHPPPPNPHGPYTAGAGVGGSASQGAVVRPLGDVSADDAETALESLDHTRAVRPGARRPPLHSQAPQPLTIQTGATAASPNPPADASPRSPISAKHTSAFPTQMFAHHHPFSGDSGLEDSLVGSPPQRTAAHISAIAVAGRSVPRQLSSQSALS
jgi:hypothetical protein